MQKVGVDEEEKNVISGRGLLGKYDSGNNLASTALWYLEEFLKQNVLKT